MKNFTLGVIIGFVGFSYIMEASAVDYLAKIDSHVVKILNERLKEISR